MTPLHTVTLDVSTPTTPCREWQGARGHGYGQRATGGRRFQVHRWVVETAGEDQFGTPWDPNLEVMHLCDNRPCFRFDHLRLGTKTDNMADMVAKGRSNTGERNPAAKLAEADVLVIRQRLADGETRPSIAREFQVSLTTITYVKQGKRWGSVAS